MLGYPEDHRSALGEHRSVELADEACNGRAGYIVQGDTESNDDGCGYPTGGTPLGDMQPERARLGTVCWPSEAPSELRLCAPDTTGSTYRVNDAEASMRSRVSCRRHIFNRHAAR